MTLGELLRKKRSEKGLSEKEAAHLLGMDKHNYLSFERGFTKHPQTDTWKKFSKVLDINIGEITNIN